MNQEIIKKLIVEGQSVLTMFLLRIARAEDLAGRKVRMSRSNKKLQSSISIVLPTEEVKVGDIGSKNLLGVAKVPGNEA